MKFFHVFQLLVGCALFQLCTLNHTRAQNTRTLNIQGVLRKSNETAVENGFYKIKFSLYTVETGGVAVWSETQDSLVVNGGVYSTALGKKTPINVAFDQVYYLGVKVGTGQEMTPRTLLSSAPYALSLLGQSNIFPSSGPVGVGTASPNTGTELHVKDTSNAQVLIEGVNGSEIKFKKGANSASITYDGTNINIPNLKMDKNNSQSDWILVDTDDFSIDNEGWISDRGSTERIKFETTARDGYVLKCANYTTLSRKIDLTGIPHKQVKVVFNAYSLYQTSQSDEFIMWAGFLPTPWIVTYQRSQNNALIVSWSKIKRGSDPGSSYFAFPYPNGDYVERGEMVIASSRDVIYVNMYGGSDTNNQARWALSDVEIWVK